MFVNWETNEVHYKLVYYGPPLSGKTTNLEQLHQQLPQPSRSDLVSVKTREDRTLFFDFMELSLGQINGMQPKFKLYTVPGQSYYAATRQLVLRNVDGLVFVADSASNRLKDNQQAMSGMHQQLQTLGLSLQDLPFVLQCNKQDLDNAIEPNLLAYFLSVKQAPIIPAVALQKKGTGETLKQLMGLVLKKD